MHIYSFIGLIQCFKNYLNSKIRIEKNNEPHIHVRYNEYEMSMTLEGKILDGNIPNKQKKIVEAWRVVHEDELKAAWYAYNNDGEIVKIKGLE